MKHRGFCLASAHTEGHGVDEYPDISGITTARVSQSLYVIIMNLTAMIRLVITLTQESYTQ